ncbi:MAG: hypothetical protein ACW99A_13335 [Candidatus Kariarchaeaceae archaeon]|jgi:hypothetical protein
MIKKLLITILLFSGISLAQTGWVTNYDLDEDDVIRFTVEGSLDTLTQTNDTLYTPTLEFFVKYSNYYWTLFYNFDASAIKADIFMERGGEFSVAWNQFAGDTLVTGTTDGGDNWVTYDPGGNVFDVVNTYSEQYRMGVANAVGGDDSTYFKMQWLGVKK